MAIISFACVLKRHAWLLSARLLFSGSVIDVAVLTQKRFSKKIMENFTAYVSKRKEENQPDSKFDGWLNPKINPGWIITGHQGGSISPQKAHKHSLLKPNMGHSLTKNAKNIIFFALLHFLLVVLFTKFILNLPVLGLQHCNCFEFDLKENVENFRYTFF